MVFFKISFKNREVVNVVNYKFCTRFKEMQMSCRKREHDADAFYITGTFNKVGGIQFHLNECKKFCGAYETYSKCSVRNLNKPWALQVACSNCKRFLEYKQFLL